MNYKADVHLCTKPGTLKGYATITLNEEFVIKGLNIRAGANGLFVSMPSVKNGNRYYDTVYPITAEAREQLNKTVLDQYELELGKLEEQLNIAKQGTQKREENSASFDTGKRADGKYQNTVMDQEIGVTDQSEALDELEDEQFGQTMGGM